MKTICLKPTGFYFFIFSLFILFCHKVNAQQASVKFKITTIKNEPVVFASVKVISFADTANALEKLSDSSGMVSFNLEQNHPYIINVTSVNYKPFSKTINFKGSQTSFTLVIEAQEKTL